MGILWYNLLYKAVAISSIIAKTNCHNNQSSIVANLFDLQYTHPKGTHWEVFNFKWIFKNRKSITMENEMDFVPINLT